MLKFLKFLPVFFALYVSIFYIFIFQLNISFLSNSFPSFLQTFPLYASMWLYQMPSNKQLSQNE